MNKGKLRTFEKNIEILSSFVLDDQWRSSLLVDVALDYNYERWIVKTIQEIIQDAPSGKSLEVLLTKIRKRCLYFLKKVDQGSSSLERWKTARLAYSHYAFLESIIEASIFSERVVENLKKRFGNEYLDIITEVDRFCPSKITGVEVQSGKPIIGIFCEAEIKDYLTLKKWQDSQHIFHDSVLDPVFSKARDEFNQWIHKEYPETKKVNGMTLIVLGVIAQKKLIEINEIARFILAGIDKELTCLVGGKGLGLGRLVAFGENVPNGYIITTSSVRMNNYQPNLINFSSNKRWAVRSSATVEDGLKHSFAGMFESYLDVEASSLSTFIHKILQSVESERVKAYITRFKTPHPEMAIVIQEFRTPSISGVWIGRDTKSGTLEWVKGTGDKLVLGRVKPNRENWIGRYKKSAISSSTGAIGKEAINLQQKLGSSADLEWCLVGRKLFWLQYRPVTSVIKHIQKPLSGSLSGVPASSGVVVGRARVVSALSKKMTWGRDDILVTEFTDPDWVPIMIKSKAVVTVEGGFLSHAAIIARELGIPCVTGVRAALNIKSGTRISVDGNRGVVVILNKTPA
jgi:pyruvate,water dikinase